MTEGSNTTQGQPTHSSTHSSRLRSVPLAWLLAVCIAHLLPPLAPHALVEVLSSLCLMPKVQLSQASAREGRRFVQLSQASSFLRQRPAFFLRQKRLNEVNAREERNVGKSIDLSGCHMRCGSFLIRIFEF